MELCSKEMTSMIRRLSSLLIRRVNVLKNAHHNESFICTSANRLQEMSEPPVLSPETHAPETALPTGLPLVTSRQLQYLHPHMKPQQAWLETLGTVEDEKLGVVDLHPEIFATNPRIDILHRNVHWQRTYKRISYAKTKSRAEVRGGGRKPWPQKGMNKARHGSIRSPLWTGGGRSFGPRGPKSYFYMLPTSVRALGLRCALSVKYAQNDLHIVDSLKIPYEKQFIEDLVEHRNWGYSVLFVDDKDFMPRSISLALSKIPEFNLMPVYGLNVYSILKHETLVLTLAAVEKLESKLLYQMHKTGLDTKFRSDRGVGTPKKFNYWR